MNILQITKDQIYIEILKPTHNLKSLNWTGVSLVTC